MRLEFERYERALRAHDVEALNGFFLDSPSTVRFGLAEEHYGFDAIAAFRRISPPVHPERTLRHTRVHALTADVACVSTQFSDPDSAQLGRQSQTWLRTATGWKIAMAHVSARIET